MEEERLRVLRLLEEGRINHQEAAELLEALQEKAADDNTFDFGGRAPRLHIRITDSETGRLKTDVVLPTGLLGRRWSRKLLSMLAGRHHHFKGFTEDSESTSGSARKGTIVDVTDDERRERVEIVVE